MMGPELEMKPKPGAAMEVSIAKDGSTQHGQEDNIMPCVCNYKGNIMDLEAPLVGHTTETDRRKNEELNGAGCTSPDGVQLVQGGYGDLSKYSSSFGTMSETENGSALDGDEAESQLRGDEFVAVYDQYVGAYQPRKKKLTELWKKFSHPQRWLGKWVELRIRECDSQLRQYKLKLAKYEKEKLSASEGFDAMSAPKFMKRKKRKRVEDTTDIASYISHHNLFSYDSKRSIANGVCVEEDDLGGKTSNGNNEETNDVWSFLESRDGDSPLEDILWKIEVVHSHVWQLKTRIDKVMKENPGNFSSVNKLLVPPCDALKGSAHNSASTENGNRLLVGTLSTASQHIECKMEDIPQTAVSSHAELTPFPGTAGNTDHPWVGSVLENVEDAYLIPNAAVEDKPHNFEEVKDQVLQKPNITNEVQKSNFPVAVLETLLPTNSPAPVSETVLPTNSCVPNATQESDSTTRTGFRFNTRNRGRRKPGSYSYKLSRKS